MHALHVAAEPARECAQAAWAYGLERLHQLPALRTEHTEQCLGRFKLEDIARRLSGLPGTNERIAKLLQGVRGIFADAYPGALHFSPLLNANRQGYLSIALVSLL